MLKSTVFVSRSIRIHCLLMGIFPKGNCLIINYSLLWRYWSELWRDCRFASQAIESMTAQTLVWLPFIKCINLIFTRFCWLYPMNLNRFVFLRVYILQWTIFFIESPHFHANREPLEAYLNSCSISTVLKLLHFVLIALNLWFILNDLICYLWLFKR